MNDPSVSTPQSDDTAIDVAETADDQPQPDLAHTMATMAADDETPGDHELDTAPAVDESIDLDAIERDLTDVQTALERLNDGTYWTDEVTGDALPDDVLASFPLTRTVTGSATA